MFFTYISKNFNNYKLYLNFVKFNSISNKKPNLLGSYLAGLIEGDGYILLRKEQKKNSCYYNNISWKRDSYVWKIKIST